MITRQLFRNPLARVLLLCVCLGVTGVFMAGCSSKAERAQAFYERGMTYLEQKDYVKARIELRNALQLKGDMLPAWKAMAEIDEHDQNLQALAGTLRRITELDSNDLTATVKLARLYLLGNAPDRALKLANTAGELDPKSADVLALKAAILFKLKDLDGATRAAQEALAIDPGHTGANSIVAAVKFSQGDSAGALKSLGNIRKESEDDLGVVFLKINIYSQSGQLPQAEALLRRLVERNPKVAAFRTELIRFYLRNKRPDDAINELRSVAAADPADAASELQLVNLLGASKGPAAARAELVTRIKGGGNVFPYQIALAKFDFAQNNAPESIKLLQQLIQGAASPEDKLAAKTTLAEVYAATNNVTAEEPLVTEILAADSHNITGLRLRAALHLNRGQVDDAIGDLRTALNYQARSPDLLAGLAIAYERNGSIELADKAFFDATKASNYAPAIGLNYVAFLRRRGMTAQADSVITDLANRNENSIPVLTALAQNKLERQDWAGAHAVADALHKLDDKSSIADQIDAAAFSGQGKFTDSLAVLQNSYNANPGAIRPMVDLVSAYVRSGKTTEAEGFVRSVLVNNPANAEALVLLGSIQQARNAPTEAEKSFKLAIEKKPADAAGYRALANLYIRERKNDQALGVTREGLKQQPGDFSLHLLVAGLLEAKRDYDGAIAEYDALLKDQPGSLVVVNNLASLLADHRTDKASLDRASGLAQLLKSSQVPQFMDTLGWVSYQRADYRAAQPLLENAVKALPNVATARFHLGMTYLATGQDEKAAEQFKQARTLAPDDAELGAKIDAALKSRTDKTKG